MRELFEGWLRMVEKNTTSNIQSPEGQPGTVWGQGFNKYYTPHTKPSRANLWGELKSAIGEKNPANVQELEQIAKEEWEKITAEKCKKLIDGFKKRLDAVIAAKGCATKY